MPERRHEAELAMSLAEFQHLIAIQFGAIMGLVDYKVKTKKMAFDHLWKFYKKTQKRAHELGWTTY